MRLPAAVAVLLASGLLVTSAAVASAPTLGKPSLTPGDSWSYRVNSTTSLGGTLAVGLTGNVTLSVADRETTTVNGSSVDAFRVTTSGQGIASGVYQSHPFAGVWILTGEQFLEAGELQVVSNIVDLSVNGTFVVLVPLPFEARVQNTTTFGILQDTWRYPLAANTTGSVTETYAYRQDVYFDGTSNHTAGSGTWTIAYAMGGPGTVSVAAGTFPTFAVRQTFPDGTAEVAYDSPDVGNAVLIQEYNATGGLLATESLTAYRYQALEPPTFLGLTLVEWGIVAAVVAAAVIVGFLWYRRRGTRRGTSSPETPPNAPREPPL